MIGKRKILFFCMIVVANGAFSQFKIPGIKTIDIKPSPVIILPDNKTFPTNLLPGNFSTNHLGFFCRQELRLESITKIPFKFRLGNVQYCDWLEGKKTAGLVPPVY